MKRQLVKPSAAATIGLILTAPTAYFILIALLKYAFGLPGLFDASEPLLTSLGANKPLGWNINLLILFGPLLSILLNVSAIVSLNWRRSEELFTIQLSLERKLWNWIALAISGGCLLMLFIYALGENCRC
jgi:hypothetical protein